MPDSDNALEQNPQPFGEGADPATIAGIEDAEDGAAAEPEEATEDPGDDQETPTEGEPSGPDFSFLNDDLKARLEEDPAAAAQDPKFWDEVRRGYLRNKDYTQKTQQLSEQRKQLSALEQDAQYWRELISDPARREHVLSFGKQNGGPKEETPDLLAMTPEEMLAYFDKRYGERIKQAEEVASRRTIETLAAPARHAQMLNEAAAEWATANGIEDDLVNAAGAAIQQDMGGIDKITVDVLPILLNRYVENERLKREKAALESSRKSNASKVTRARAASPKGGTSTVAPGAASLEARLGRKPTPEDIFDDWLRSTGMTERDMDETLRLKQ